MIIEMIPTLPLEIKRAINQDTLVIFLGAGISKQFNLPLWNELTSRLLSNLVDDGLLSPSEKSLFNLDLLADNKKIISIVYEKYRSSGRLDDFNSKLKEYLTICKSQENLITKFIDAIPALYLTTNVDNSLDVLFPPENRYYQSDYQWPVTGNSIVHIHGKLDDMSTLVFTASQYISRYTDNQYIDYLSRVFASGRTILFIGYSLTEFELLEKIKRNIPLESSYEIFTLSPYFSYQLPLKQSLDLYFASLSISQLAYNIDESGYKQLEFVLKEWLLDIERSSLSIVIKKRINIYISKMPDKHTVPQLKNIIKKNEALIIYAISQFNKYNYSKYWLFEFSNLSSTSIQHAFERINHPNSSLVYMNTLIETYLILQDKDLVDVILVKILALFRHRNLSDFAKNPNVTIFTNISKLFFDFPEIYQNQDVIHALPLMLESNPRLFFSFTHRLVNHISFSVVNPQLTNIELTVYKLLAMHPNSEYTFMRLDLLVPYLIDRDLGSYAFEISALSLESIEIQLKENSSFFFGVGSLINFKIDPVISNKYGLLNVLLYSIKALEINEISLFMSLITNSLFSSHPLLKKLSLYILHIASIVNHNFLTSDYFYPFYDPYFFSDYYIVIKKHLNSLSSEYISFIIKKLNNIHFENCNNKEKSMIIELYSLLSDSGIIDKIDNFELNKETTIKIVPEDVSTLVRFRVYDTDSLASDIKELTKEICSIKLICQKIEELKEKSFITDYSSALEKYLVHSSTNFQLNIDELESINPTYFEAIANYLAIKKTNNFDFEIKDYFKQALIISSRKRLYQTLNSLVNKLLHSDIIESIDISELFTSDLIMKLLSKLTKKPNDNRKISILSRIDNHWLFNLLQLLLEKSSTTFTNHLIDFYQVLTTYKWKPEFYAFMFINIDKLRKINNKIVTSILKDFNNEFEIINKPIVLRYIFINSFDNSTSLHIKKSIRSLNYFSVIETSSEYSDHLIRNELKWLLSNFTLNQASLSKQPFIGLKALNNMDYLSSIIRILSEKMKSKDSLKTNEFIFFISLLNSMLTQVRTTDQANKIYNDLIYIYSIPSFKDLDSDAFIKLANLFNDQLDENYYCYLNSISHRDYYTVQSILLENAKKITLYYLDSTEIIKILNSFKSRKIDINELILAYDSVGIDMTALI